jgi:hypothetical protein
MKRSNIWIGKLLLALYCCCGNHVQGSFLNRISESLIDDEKRNEESRGTMGLEPFSSSYTSSNEEDQILVHGVETVDTKGNLRVRPIPDNNGFDTEETIDLKMSDHNCDFMPLKQKAHLRSKGTHHWGHEVRYQHGWPLARQASPCCNQSLSQ